MKLSHHVGPLGGHYELDRKGRERLHCQGILGGWYYEQDDNFGLPDSITNPQSAYSYDDEDVKCFIHLFFIPPRLLVDRLSGKEIR